MTPEQHRMEVLSWALASRGTLVSEEGLVIIRDAIRQAEAAARADEREGLAVKIEQRIKWLAARRGMFPQSAKLANRQEEAAKCLGMIFRATKQQEAAE